MRDVAPRPQLLTYPDSLGGDLHALGDLLEGPLAGIFHGVHVLPPFPSSGDRGFAPLTLRPDRPALRDLGRHRPHRRASRRAPRPDDQPHLAPERRVPGLPAARPRVDRCRPVHHDRQGLARRPPAGRRRRADLPAQARCPVLDRHDRGHGSGGADLDVVRDRGLVRADRPRRHVGGDAHPDHALAPAVRRARRPHRAARRRRVRDQEARDVLLHGRAGDLRLPRAG